MTRGAGHLVLRQHVHGGLIQVDQEAGVQRVGDGPEVGLVRQAHLACLRRPQGTIISRRLT